MLLGANRLIKHRISIATLIGTSSVNASGGPSAVAPIPAGTQAGDVLVAVELSTNSNLGVVLAGWTQVHQVFNHGGSYLRVVWRVWDGSFPAPAWGTNKFVTLASVRGSAPVPIGAQSTHTGASNAVTAPALDTTVDDGSSVVIRTFLHRSTPALVTPTAHTLHETFSASGIHSAIVVTPDDSVNPPGATAAATSGNTVAWVASQVEIVAG